MKNWYIYLLEAGACFATILMLSHLFDKSIDYVFAVVATTIFTGIMIAFDYAFKDKSKK